MTMVSRTDINASECVASTFLDVKVTWCGAWFKGSARVDDLFLAEATGATFGDVLAKLGASMTQRTDHLLGGLPGRWRITLEPV